MRRSYERGEFEFELDEALWTYRAEVASELEAAVKDSAAAFFGPETRTVVSYRHGSILIDVVVIGALVLGHYRATIENLGWLRDHVSHVIRSIFGRFSRLHGVHIYVEASAVPGEGLIASLQGPEHAPGTGFPFMHAVIAYLMLSHAGLTAVLLWMLAERL